MDNTKIATEEKIELHTVKIIGLLVNGLDYKFPFIVIDEAFFYSSFLLFDAVFLYNKNYKNIKNDYNNYFLQSFRDLNEDNIFRISLENHLTKNNNQKLHHLFSVNFNAISYDYFKKNIAGDLNSFSKRFMKEIEFSLIKPEIRFWKDQFIHPAEIKFKIDNQFDVNFDFKFDTCEQYTDDTSDGKHLLVDDDSYFSKSIDYRKSDRGNLRTKYIITDGKLSDYSVNKINKFLIEKGFPYNDNYSEYTRFLETLNFMLKIKSNEIGKFYGMPFLELFKAFLPSKLKSSYFINHTHIVGRSGSGKSELLKTIIKQVGESCILIDPHGDIANSLDKKRTFFKIAPAESRFVINPFHITDKSIDNRELVAEEIIQLLQEIIQDSNVSVLMKTISFPIISTLLKLPYADFRMFADCINPISGLAFLERLSPLVDDHHKRLWEDLKTDAYDSTKRSIFNRLQSFLNKHKIISTVCGYDDFSETIKRVEQGENLVISLPIPQLGEDVSEVLGRFFMCRMQIWAKRRQTLAEKDRKPVLLIVDECQNYLSEETARTLDQFGRKFGLYMVLAHQHIAQIDGKGLKGSMLANCKNKIVGYCDESTAKPIGNAIGVAYEEFTELKKGHWWGLFEDQKPLKFYARLAKFKTVSEAVNYAQSQNTDFLDGWEIVQDSVQNAVQNTQKTPKFTAKFDL